MNKPNAFWLGFLACFLFIATIGADVKTARDKPEKEAPVEDADLSGIYYCEGKHAKGDYVGSCTIIKIKDTYLVNWSTGGAKGIGFVQGDRLTIGWSDGPVVGVTAYKVSGKAMHGRWTTGGRVWDETLTLLKPLLEE